MVKLHDYESEYDEYDEWLDIDSCEDLEDLQNTITSKFKLNPFASYALAVKLWAVHERTSIEYRERDIYTDYRERRKPEEIALPKPMISPEREITYRFAHWNKVGDVAYKRFPKNFIDYSGKKVGGRLITWRKIT